MKKTLFIVFMLTLGAGHLSAQNAQDSQRWLEVDVMNINGEPLKNACVTFVPPVGEIILLKSDKRGHAKLKRLDSNSYRVVVKVDGYEAQKREIVVGAKSETVAFTLQPRAH